MSFVVSRKNQKRGGNRSPEKQGFWTCTVPGARKTWDVGPAGGGGGAWAGAEPSDGGGGVRPRGGLVRTASQAGKTKGKGFLPWPLFIILNSVRVFVEQKATGLPGGCRADGHSGLLWDVCGQAAFAQAASVAPAWRGPFSPPMP